MNAEQSRHQDRQDTPPAGAMPAVLSDLRLPHVFSPAEAAQLLRQAGLAEITECALRTRAYRKQVPFHLNGRRIIFTLGDLHEIAEGDAHRPQPQATVTAPAGVPPPPPRRRPRSRPAPTSGNPWRARRPHDGEPGAGKGPRT